MANMITPPSITWFPVIRTEVRSEQRTIDGGSVIQVLGYREVQSVLYDWIDTDDLQAQIEELEAMAADGWVIDGDPGTARTEIVQKLGIFRLQVNLHRFVSS